LAFAYLAFFVLLLALGLSIAFFGDPHAGDPIVRMAMRRGEPAPAGTAQAVQAPGIHPGAADVTLPPPIMPQTVTEPVYAGHALLADPSLMENTPEGALPRIADDGTTPMRAYAAPVTAGGHPRIAIVIGGLGISAKATAEAIAGLPAGVTLAFAPYASDVQRWVGEARAHGHEVLLEVPMEPYDFPDSDPGPHTLRSGVSEDSNTTRLTWALTRFSGYTGITNLLGGRFLSDASALEPVMDYLTKRGLLFFDNGSATRSTAPDVAARVGAPFVQATVTIDTIQTAMEIDRRLAVLEAVARARGSAAGAGFLYPVTVARVAQWAQGLGGRGFVLVPASAIVSQPK
jgi:polysaccharide deacetylase 2 family uncharacterized protein YibQ